MLSPTSLAAQKTLRGFVPSLHPQKPRPREVVEPKEEAEVGQQPLEVIVVGSAIGPTFAENGVALEGVEHPTGDSPPAEVTLDSNTEIKL